MRRVFCLVLLAVLVTSQERPALAQQAQGGGVAISGSVRDSTITTNIGISTDQLEALVRDRTRLLEKYSASLERELDLNKGQVRAALGILGEANVPAEQLATKLVEVAERFKTLQATATAQPGDDPSVTALKNEAQRAIEAGDLTKADDLLAKVEALQTAALDRQALNVAETSAQRGNLALTRLRYLEAAQHFANAASRVPSGHDDKRLAYLDQEAGALYRQGGERGDNAAAQSAIERYRQILKQRPRERVPLDWATTQSNLGVALRNLGERESGTERLEQAVQAYRAALEEHTRERVPLEWAKTQNNLGIALRNLGERESSTERLEQAVQACRAALEEHTRERVPLLWAGTQNNLGLALQALSQRESSTERLEQAVQAYRLALQEFTALHAPYYRTVAEQNLSKARQLLEQRSGRGQRDR